MSAYRFWKVPLIRSQKGGGGGGFLKLFDHLTSSSDNWQLKTPFKLRSDSVSIVVAIQGGLKLKRATKVNRILSQDMHPFSSTKNASGLNPDVKWLLIVYAQCGESSFEKYYLYHQN